MAAWKIWIRKPALTSPTRMELRFIHFRSRRFRRLFFRMRGPPPVVHKNSLRLVRVARTSTFENLFEGADDLSWIKGNHSFKMGADIRRDRFDTIYGGGATVYGSIFSSSSNSPNSGAPLADFFVGRPGTAHRNAVARLGAYAQPLCGYVLPGRLESILEAHLEPGPEV